MKLMGRVWALQLTGLYLNPGSTADEMGDHGKLFNYFELISKMQMCTMSQHVRVTLIPHSLC